MKRRGFSLTEVIFMLTILAALSVVLSRLFQSLLGDVPRYHRAYNSQLTVQALLRQLEKDVDQARSLPHRYGEHTSDGSRLLLELADEVIVYEKRPDRIVRYPAGEAPAGAESFRPEEIEFDFYQADIDWTVWREGQAGYAVEVKTAVIGKFTGGRRRMFVNAAVYFLGGIPQEGTLP